MNDLGRPKSRFDTRTGQLIRRCLSVCQYHDDLIEESYALGSDRTLPVVTFAHRPHDARSSCMVFLPQVPDPQETIVGLRELGAPLIFFVGDDSWQWWSLRSEGPHYELPLKPSEAEPFFEHRKADFMPGTVFRAKTWARAQEARQLDFVDVDLLPLVEEEAGKRLSQLFEDMVKHTMDALNMTSPTLSGEDEDAHWLVQANFWLLAGKLLQDKGVPKFTHLDLRDVQSVLDRVAEHYAATERVHAGRRVIALQGAAKIAERFSSLRTISTETLGALYEKALVSERTRKLLNVHRTPTYLVDYMLAKLSHWMAEDIRNCRVFEPACGHAPFLVGAVRMLSDLLPDDVATNRAARRKFLRRHVGGCDRDAVALEIARLSLTLADIPNPNGWRLDAVEDMFASDYLDKHIAAASVVLANPPFENAPITAEQRAEGDLRHHRNGQAAGLFRRMLRSLQPGSVFGVVVPQSLLEGKPFAQMRRDLLVSCEVREVSVFPDKVFQFADVETAVILGRKLGSGADAHRPFTFRRVREADMPRFAAGYFATVNTTTDPAKIQASKDLNLVVPDLLAVWDALSQNPRFSRVAHIGNGFLFLSEENPKFPIGEVKVSETRQEGFVEGFEKATGSPDTHLLPELKWLNQKQEIIAAPQSGTQRGNAQIILNYVRVSRGA